MVESNEKVKISELPQLEGSLSGFEVPGYKEVSGQQKTVKVDLAIIEAAATEAVTQANNAAAKAALANEAAELAAQKAVEAAEAADEAH